MGLLPLTKKKWDIALKIIMNDDGMELVEIWIFYLPVNNLERILNLFYTEKISAIVKEINGCPLDEKKSILDPELIRKLLEVRKKGGDFGVKCHVVPHDSCAVDFFFNKKTHEMQIDLVFGKCESFPRKLSEIEHKKTLNRYIDFATQIRGKNKDVKCMLLEENSGAPEEHINNEDVLVW